MTKQSKQRLSRKHQLKRKLNERTSRTNGHVQSVKRALTILNPIAEHSAGLTLKDLVPIVDLPISTVHRLLTTLQSEHYAYFDNESCRWSVGLQVHVIANSLDEDLKQSTLK